MNERIESAWRDAHVATIFLWSWDQIDTLTKGRKLEVIIWHLEKALESSKAEKEAFGD